MIKVSFLLALKILLTTAIMILIFFHFAGYSKVYYSFKISNKEQVIQNKLEYLGVKHDIQEITRAVIVTSKEKEIDHNLLMALHNTESNFKKKAKSKKNYHGVGQIPYPIYDYMSNMMVSADIFNEKLRFTKGNVEEAIILYKGWKIQDKKGQYNAQKVLYLASALSTVQ